MNTRNICLMALIPLVVSFPGRAMAQVEQWCQNNPNACVCSRTFQAGDWSLYTPYGGWAWRQVAESKATNICGTLDGDGNHIIATYDRPLNVTSGVGNLMAVQMSGTSTMNPLSKDGLQGRRVGFRYYHYWSPDFGSTSTIDPTNLCNNDKYTQLGDYLTAYTDRFTSSNGGGSLLPTSINPTTMRGKWGMIEHYIQVYGTAPTLHEYYVTDLSTGNVASSIQASRLSELSTYLTDTTDIIHRYRSGPCAGSYRMMYAAMASWPAGGNQRIPPAVEFNNGFVPAPAPAPSPSPDTVAPSATILSPANGATVKISAGP
jgi:hypothetical protein